MHLVRQTDSEPIKLGDSNRNESFPFPNSQPQTILIRIEDSTTGNFERKAVIGVMIPFAAMASEVSYSSLLYHCWNRKPQAIED